jgi:hypothetical protein
MAWQLFMAVSSSSGPASIPGSLGWLSEDIFATVVGPTGLERLPARDLTRFGLPSNYGITFLSS